VRSNRVEDELALCKEKCDITFDIGELQEEIVDMEDQLSDVIDEFRLSNWCATDYEHVWVDPPTENLDEKQIAMKFERLTRARKEDRDWDREYMYLKGRFSSEAAKKLQTEVGILRNSIKVIKEELSLMTTTEADGKLGLTDPDIEWRRSISSTQAEQLSDLADELSFLERQELKKTVRLAQLTEAPKETERLRLHRDTLINKLSAHEFHKSAKEKELDRLKVTHALEIRLAKEERVKAARQRVREERRAKSARARQRTFLSEKLFLSNIPKMAWLKMGLPLAAWRPPLVVQKKRKRRTKRKKTFAEVEVQHGLSDSEEEKIEIFAPLREPKPEQEQEKKTEESVVVKADEAEDASGKEGKRESEGFHTDDFEKPPDAKTEVQKEFDGSATFEDMDMGQNDGFESGKESSENGEEENDGENESNEEESDSGRKSKKKKNRSESSEEESNEDEDESDDSSDTGRKSKRNKNRSEGSGDESESESDDSSDNERKSKRKKNRSESSEEESNEDEDESDDSSDGGRKSKKKKNQSESSEDEDESDDSSDNGRKSKRKNARRESSEEESNEDEDESDDSSDNGKKSKKKNVRSKSSKNDNGRKSNKKNVRSESSEDEDESDDSSDDGRKSKKKNARSESSEDESDDD
jgi:hypothetical protein